MVAALMPLCEYKQNKNSKTGLTDVLYRKDATFIRLSAHAHTVAYLPIARAYMLCTASDEN